MEKDQTTERITHKAIRSLKWSALIEMVSRTASPIVTIVLARLLTPTDFGVVAAAMAAISLASMFCDAGLSKALVQTKESPEEAAHVVFWTNLFLGIVVYALLYATAPWVAVFFKSPGSARVLQVLGLQIIIASLTSVQQALFVRDLDFRRLLRVKLLTAFVPGLFSVPMAYYGLGVWALVAGTLVGQVMNLALLWRHGSWRPGFSFDLSIAMRLFGFGGWLLAEGIGGWLMMWGDSLIVGRFLGVNELGVYRTGFTMVTIIFGLVLNPFLPVLFPTFSRLQHDIPALKENFHKVNRVIMSLTLPLAIGLLLLGPRVALVLFGDRWQGLGIVLSLIGLMFGVAWLTSMNPEIYRAMGRPEVNSFLMFAQLIVYLPAYYIAAQHGLYTFLVVRVSLAALALPTHIYVCVRMLGVSFGYLWHDGSKFILSAAVMGCGMAVTGWILHATSGALPASAELAVLAFLGAGMYVTALWMLERAFILQTINLAKRVAAG